MLSGYINCKAPNPNPSTPDPILTKKSCGYMKDFRQSKSKNKLISVTIPSPLCRKHTVYEH